MKNFGVYSEIGKLRKVLVCRPGLAHERLTPSNCDELLFDDVLWVDKAIEDHSKFVSLMKSYSVEVLELHDLLEEVFLDTELRKGFLDKKLHAYTFMDAYDDVYGYFMSIDSKLFTKHMIGGLLKKEFPKSLGRVYDKLISDNGFVIRPLPNTVFMRDQSAWIGSGVQVSSMHYSVRHEETLLLDMVYRHHKDFMLSDNEFLSGHQKEFRYDYSVEGGDVLVASKDLVLVGVGERSKYEAVYHLAKQLFKHGEIKRVLLVDIPKERASMHLDTVLTFCDKDAISMYPEISKEFRMKSLVPSDKEGEIDVIEEKEDIRHLLERYLNLGKLRVIETGGDYFSRQREQWDDANNVICIEPGLVFGYDRNKNTLSNFKKEGIRVEVFPSSELGRGRGGARCMTCPILRDDV